jgi:magnesium transporter
VVWDLVKTDREGEILLEVSDAVRETLIAHMDEDELVAATAARYRRDRRPRARPAAREYSGRLPVLSPAERDQLRAAMSYEEDTVGR